MEPGDSTAPGPSRPDAESLATRTSVRVVVHDAAHAAEPPSSVSGDFEEPPHWADGIGPALLRRKGDGGEEDGNGGADGDMVAEPPAVDDDPEFDAVAARDALIRDTLAILGEGGTLQFLASGRDFRFEPRPQQVEMASAVASAVALGQHLVAEAATGVGKSLAYLVPLVLHARRRGRRVLVSTHTIALQEQLVRKDIPLLRDATGIPFRAVLVKGRSNYLCLRRLARAKHQQRELFPTPVQLAFEELAEWARATEDGSLQDLRHAPPAELWSAVCAESGNCLGPKCREFKRCFFQRARARMLDADLLVVNHSLFFSDLAIRQGGGQGFLPAVDAVVLDEAHTVEDTATDYLGISLSQASFEVWLRRLFVPDSGKGLLGALRLSVAAHAATRLWNSLPRLMENIAAAADFPPADSQRVLSAPLESDLEAIGDLHALDSHLHAALEGLKEDDPESWAELRSLQLRGQELCSSLEAWLEQRLPGHVYWLEREGHRRQLRLRSAPVEVGPVLRKVLWDEQRAVVLSSATLAVAGRLDYVKNRLGCPPDTATRCVGSPFDHARQMRLYLAPDIPDPGKDAEAWESALFRGIFAAVAKTGGRAFVLFTSAKTLRRAAEVLRPALEGIGIATLVQGEGMPRNAMLEKFRKAEKPYALFGLESFWMGVDVQGAALSNVVITRLPFAVPDHPVVRARVNAIQARGGSAFAGYTVPEAVLKFRQGVGRLIRSQTDTGIVVVLDSRLKHKSYGRTFLNSLPPCPVGWLWLGKNTGDERWEEPRETE